MTIRISRAILTILLVMAFATLLLWTFRTIVLEFKGFAKQLRTSP